MEAGFSQQDLARIVGVSRNAVSQWEAGETAPAATRLTALARALGVRLDQLLEPSAEVRNRVIEVARRIFNRLGVEETTVEVICAAAEVDIEEFESMFPTKGDLLYEVIKSYNRQTFDDVRRIPPKYGTIDARIKYLLRVYYAHDLQYLHLTAAMHAYSWQWSSTRERENLAQLSEHHEIILQVMDEAADKGEIGRGNYRHASHLIFAAYTYTLRRAVFDEYNADMLVEAMSPQLEIILAGLGFPGDCQRSDGED